jgi:glycerophosphoryl diester phosphodiesterase
MSLKKRIDIQGHRGARGLFPENTISAFIEAVKLGVDTIEMDVVISKDKQVIVSHEPWMNELICLTPDGSEIEKNSAEKYNLYQMNYDEIRSYDCGKKGNPEFPLQKKMAGYKPLLSEVIKKVEAFTKENNLKNINYNIEIKSEAEGDNTFHPDPGTFACLVYNEIKKHNAINRTILQSFDNRILKEIRKKDKEIKIALLVENNLGLEENLGQLGFVPDIYAPGYVLTDEKLVKKVHHLNMKLIPWTVNEISEMKRLIEMGADGIITDYPDRAVGLLR